MTTPETGALNRRTLLWGVAAVAIGIPVAVTGKQVGALLLDEASTSPAVLRAGTLDISTAKNTTWQETSGDLESPIDIDVESGTLTRPIAPGDQLTGNTLLQTELEGDNMLATLNIETSGGLSAEYGETTVTLTTEDGTVLAGPSPIGTALTADGLTNGSKYKLVAVTNIGDFPDSAAKRESVHLAYRATLAQKPIQKGQP